MKRLVFGTICPFWVAVVLSVIGCGGGSGTTVSNPNKPQGKLVDPSGNWRMTFTDTNNNSFLLPSIIEVIE
jgi:hypothetical protein